MVEFVYISADFYKENLTIFSTETPFFKKKCWYLVHFEQKKI